MFVDLLYDAGKEKIYVFHDGSNIADYLCDRERSGVLIKNDL
jgi:hypothetical protein